jgi:proteic killer suppression protein
LSRFFATGSKVGIQAADVKPLKLILATLNAATLPGDMGLPGLKRHPPKSSRRGSWSVTARANWRVTLRFDGKDAVDVYYEDYH